VKRLLRAAAAVHDWLTDIGYVVAAILIAAMCAIYTLEVVLRYFFNAPTTWASETLAHLMLIIVFLASPYATRAGQQVAVTLLADLRPQYARQIGVVLNLVGAALCLFVAYICLGENIRQYVVQVETLGNIPLPKWWISSWVTFGFASTAIWFLRLAFAKERLRPRWKFLPGAHA
jgi:TRAP-type C4-dicarboxylate transport system permease small subunit